MVNKLVVLSGLSFLILTSCGQGIKNEKATVYDEVIDSANQAYSSTSSDNQGNSNVLVTQENDILGFWVGDFEVLEENDSIRWAKSIAKDEGLSWNRTNKINIAIDNIEKDKVIGHSVVAGNYRPFKGTVTKKGTVYVFEVKEPGDDKYDGKFQFSIILGDSLLQGTWSAYKNIDIKHREYTLQKKIYTYNPNQPLLRERRYANWNKEIRTEFMNEIDEETFMDFSSEFESATDEIYKYNASNTKLTKSDVENLKQGDLFIIRNTIYARHGYSFKNRPLRVFFDAQPWYIPVHNDIKKELTPLEQENIKLLMKYEKNGKAYYDYFGRG